MCAPANRRGRVLVVVLVLIVLLIAGGIAAWWAWGRSRSRVSALIHVSFTQPYLAWPSEPNPHALRDYERFKNTQAEMIKSRRVLESAMSGVPDPAKRPETALQHPPLPDLAFVRSHPDIVGWLEEHIEVSFPDNTEFLEVSLPTEDHPEEAAALLNAVVQAYVSMYLDEDDERSNSLVRMLQIEIDARGEAIEKQNQLLHKLAREHNVEVPTDKSLTLADQIYTQRSLQDHHAVREHELEIVKLTALLDEYRRLLRASHANSEMKSEVESEVRARKPKLLDQFRTLKSTVSEAYSEPEKGNLPEELRVALADLEATLEASESDQHTQREAAIHGSIEELERRIAAEKKVISTIRTSIAQAKERKPQKARVPLDILFQQREIKSQEEVLEHLSQRKVMLQTERKAPQRVRIYQLARVPE